MTTHDARPEFTVDEALSIADSNSSAYENVASVSRTLAAEVRALRAEVERLTKLWCSARDLVLEATARAEAVEARVARLSAAACRLIDRSLPHNKTTSNVFANHLSALTAALNDQGQDND